MKTSVIFGTLAYASLSLGTAIAGTVTVCPSGCEHTTVQGAINAAASGDVVSIAPGTYNESLSIIGKALTLQGPQSPIDNLGPLTTNPQARIVGTGSGPTVVLGSGTESSAYKVTIADLTISNGSHSTGTGVGGGIQVRQGAYLYLQNSAVSHNLALSGGGIGINTPGGPATTITSSIVDSNVAGGHGGGIYVASGSIANIESVSVSGNVASGVGGGIDSEPGSQVKITGSDISRNQLYMACYKGAIGPAYCAAGGGGVALQAVGSISDSSITKNTIDEAQASGQDQSVTNLPGPAGGGLYLASTGQSVSSTVISGNYADYDGGGVFISSGYSSAPVILNDVYIVNNTLRPGNIYSAGGLDSQASTAPVANNTTIANNVPTNCGFQKSCP